MKDENEKCVSCIKSGQKFCVYGESATKCCNLTDYSPHCSSNCSNSLYVVCYIDSLEYKILSTPSIEYVHSEKILVGTNTSMLVLKSNLYQD